MKKIILCSFISLIFNALSFGQINIPDIAFAQEIKKQCPTCIDGSNNLTAEAANLAKLVVQDPKIASIEGIKGFISLTDLTVFSTQITVFPELPQGLKNLDCQYNQLIVLPQLPQGLQELACSSNQLTFLPQLPPNLISLSCDANQITFLPKLPPNLISLFCSKNILVSLPQLPKGLITLRCTHNQLTALPQLPKTLYHLYTNSNPNLYCLDGLLPPSLIYFEYSGTKITCLPNKPAGIANNPLPICDAANSGSCFSFPAIKGNIFLDFDDDGLKNNNDVFVSNQKLEGKPNGFAITDTNGNYILSTDTAKILVFTLKNTPQKFEIKPTQRTVNTTGAIGQVIVNQDFRLVAKEIFGDLELSVVSSVQRPGFEGTLTITYRNIGSTTLSGQINLQKDQILSFIKAIPSENSISSNIISWNYAQLKPFETRIITVTVKVSTTAAIGSKLVNIISATFKYASDDYPTQKIVENTTVVGSYDPNDKTADVKNIEPQDISNKKPITYTIRFQNTGTYYAERIEVQDTISSSFDLSTLKTIATSHPNYEVSIAIDRFKKGQPTVVKWTFDKIFLLDSASNEPASHGFIRFSIQPKQGLPLGTSLDNKAFIYFDYNLPIITNTSKVKVQKVVGAQETEVEIPLKVYPNPTADKLFVETLPGTEGGLFLTNLLGQNIDYQLLSKSNNTTFDLKTLPKGIYILTLKTKEGSTSKRIVRQ
jgi:uncharacterized repeat protein (TIGR01451 family)